MFGFTIISKERLHRLEELAMNSNEYDAVAYTKAYNAGYEAGRENALYARYTPNEIRELLGYRKL